MQLLGPSINEFKSCNDAANKKQKEELHMKDATLAQGNQVLNLILQKRTPSKQLQKLLASGLLSDILDANLENGVNRNTFRSVIGLKPFHGFSKNATFDYYGLSVNYDLSVEAAVKAGKYDLTNENITSKNFPSIRRGMANIDIILVHYNQYMESDEVIHDLDKGGLRLRPAELPELLAFGAKYSDIQRDFPIIALGSAWRDCLCASLDMSGSMRHLALSRMGSRWSEICRFAAVRK